MRWIITIDYHGGCLGVGENTDGLPWQGTSDEAKALPVEFRLYHASGHILFEGRCGDIDADWWHGFEPLIYTWNSFRCRRMTYRRAGSRGEWRPFTPCFS